LELLDEQRPDLLLLDLSMPGIDGVAVLSAVRVRADLAHIPVIAYTARASHPERSRIVAFGFDHCVVKPIMHEKDLLDPIAHLLNRAAA
jgi:CheY-like chemotaxis protein